MKPLNCSVGLEAVAAAEDLSPQAPGAEVIFERTRHTEIVGESRVWTVKVGN